ncbi:malonyl-CoA/methylmalonyl-CoA synthetase [Oxalobacteraceae bacterium GrIS 1.18]
MSENANLYSLIEKKFPSDLTAACLITAQGAQYSWNDLDQASAKLANLLTSLELPKGSRVAAHVEKSPEALLLYLATLRAGLIFIPLNTAYQSAEMRYFIEDAQPAVVVCSPKNFGWLAQLAFQLGCSHVFTLDDTLPNQGSLLQRAALLSSQFQTVSSDPDDIASILYTSGTTGKSKGAMLSHHNLSSNALALHATWQWQASDVLLHTLPLFHVHGLFISCHVALLSGSTMIFLPKFDAPQVLQFLPRSTVFMGVPTYYVRLLEQDGLTQQLCRSVRLFISGSAPLLDETFHSFQRRTGHTILERYGMSETNIICSNPGTGQRKAGTVGLPLIGEQVRTVDDQDMDCAVNEIGHIQVKGPNVFRGYWQMPEKTAQEFTADGFFKTGDLGRFDADGYLSIVGRSKDLIISGGYNIYPKEIELLLDAMPGVVESAVIGLPHKDFGEAVCAVLVCDKVIDTDQLIAMLKTQIANFKVPKKIVIVDELPRNGMGKVQKNLLRDTFPPAAS